MWVRRLDRRGWLASGLGAGGDQGLQSGFHVVDLVVGKRAGLAFAEAVRIQANLLSVDAETDVVRRCRVRLDT